MYYLKIITQIIYESEEKMPLFNGDSSQLKDKLTYIHRKVQNFQLLDSPKQALISLGYGVSISTNKNFSDTGFIF